MNRLLFSSAMLLLMSAPIFAQPAANDSILVNLRKGKTAEAEKHFTDRFAKGGKKDDVYFYLSGRIKFSKNDNEGALDDFEETLELKKNVAEYHLWTGRAAGRSAQKASVFRQPGLAKQCRTEFEKAVQLDPTSIEAKNDLIGYYLQAPSIMGGSPEKAAQLAADIEKRDVWQGFFARTRVESSRKNVGELEKIFATASQKWPDSAQVHNQYGLFLVEQKQFDKAFPLFVKVEALRPQEWGAKYQIAKLSANSGKFVTEALPRIKALTEKPPVDDAQWKAYFHLRHGQILEHAGKKAEAKTEFQKSLALKNDLEDAKKGLERVK